MTHPAPRWAGPGPVAVLLGLFSAPAVAAGRDVRADWLPGRVGRNPETARTLAEEAGRGRE